MADYWYCATCFSQNRPRSDRCYKCDRPRGAEADPTFAATASQGRTATSRSAVASAASQPVPPPVLDEATRWTARSVMDRGYSSAWQLGYVAAGMLILTAIVLVVAALAWLPRLLSSITNAPLAPNSLIDACAPSLPLLCVLGPLTIAIHSMFLYRSAKAAPALGSGSAHASPMEAGAWWLESELSAIGGAAALTVPFMFIGIFGGLIGRWLIRQGGFGFWVLGNPIGYFNRSRQVLTDLWERFAIPGQSGARTITLWSFCWAMTHLVAMAFAEVLAWIFIAVWYIATVDGRPFSFSPEFASVVAALTLICLVVALLFAVVALYLLAEITWELAKRQRVREQWVLAAVPMSAPIPAMGWPSPYPTPMAPPPGQRSAPQVQPWPGPAPQQWQGPPPQQWQGPAPQQWQGPPPQQWSAPPPMPATPPQPPAESWPPASASPWPQDRPDRRPGAGG